MIRKKPETDSKYPINDAEFPEEDSSYVEEDDELSDESDITRNDKKFSKIYTFIFYWLILCVYLALRKFFAGDYYRFKS